MTIETKPTDTDSLKEVTINIYDAERIMVTVMNDPKLLGGAEFGQALATFALGIIRLNAAMHKLDLDEEEEVGLIETLLQNAALLTMPASDVVS